MTELELNIASKKREIEIQLQRVKSCLCGPWWDYVRSYEGVHPSHANYIARSVREYTTECRILAVLETQLAELLKDWREQ